MLTAVVSFALTFSVSPPIAASGIEDCTMFVSEGGAREEYECVGRNIARKEKMMTALYEQAIAYLKKNARDKNGSGYFDERRDPTYLTRAQKAWQEYVDLNCTVVGGLMGGSNAWVSRDTADCYSAALDERIKFLKSIVNGEYEG